MVCEILSKGGEVKREYLRERENSGVTTKRNTNTDDSEFNSKLLEIFSSFLIQPRSSTGGSDKG